MPRNRIVRMGEWELREDTKPDDGSTVIVLSCYYGPEAFVHQVLGEDLEDLESCVAHFTSKRRIAESEAKSDAVKSVLSAIIPRVL